jgi:hypothetical protein
MSRAGTSRIWTEEAVATLRQLFPTKPSNDIADIIGCSDCAVRVKAKQLGLKKVEGWSIDQFRNRWIKKS